MFNLVLIEINRNYLIILKFQNAVTQSILGLELWSMDKNDLE